MSLTMEPLPLLKQRSTLFEKNPIFLLYFFRFSFKGKKQCKDSILNSYLTIRMDQFGSLRPKNSRVLVLSPCKQAMKALMKVS